MEQLLALQVYRLFPIKHSKNLVIYENVLDQPIGINA